MYFLEEVTQDGVVLASAEVVQQRATGAAGEAGHGRAAILLVGIDQPVLQAVARPVQHLIFGDAPVARIAGRLPLIFHGQAGGIAVRGHQIAGAIPAEAAGLDIVGILHRNQLPLRAPGVVHQRTQLVCHHLMDRRQPAVRRLVAQAHVQRFVIAGDADQLPRLVPAEVLAVLVTIVNAADAPLAFASRIRLVEMKLALCGLHHYHALKRAEKRKAFLVEADNVTRRDFAQAQLLPGHITPGKLDRAVIVLKPD